MLTTKNFTFNFIGFVFCEAKESDFFEYEDCGQLH